MDTGGGNAGSSEAAKTSQNPTCETSQHSGCGCASGTTITVRVTPTTGGQFDLQVAKTESVENLKKLISKKLKVPKERICLLHRDRQLRDGTLQENNLMDGSRLTLLPSVETGLLAQRPEQSVMQALESLNDSQVNDFLSGKAPLNLTMRLGDHMMLIQLQLSTVTPSSSRRSANTNNTNTSHSSTPSLQLHTPSSTSTPTAVSSSNISNSTSSSKQNTSISSPASTSPSRNSLLSSSKIATSQSTTSDQSQQKNPTTVPVTSDTSVSSSSSTLSVSSSSSSGLKFSSPASLLTRPLTSLYSSSSSTTTTTTTSSKSSSNVETSSLESSQSSDSHIRITQSPLKSLENATNNLSVFTSSKSSSSSTTTNNSTSSSSSTSNSSSSDKRHSCSSSSSTSCKCDSSTSSKPTLDTRALAEASRNLTQTLKQLSSEVLTSRSDPAEDSARARRQGAIIESMHHHGKGVYSGTFSGTLNPALQDRFGRPKRDISTIIHILNDLLCATPQYRRHARQGHTITVEASSGSPAKTNSASTNGSSSSESRTGHNVDFIEESVTLSQENQATRGKMEQLRLIMEERRARRRARREARSAPYTVTQWSAKSESLSTQQNPAGGSGAGSLSHGDEPMDTTGDQHVCELNPPEPVVA